MPDRRYCLGASFDGARDPNTCPIAYMNDIPSALRVGAGDCGCLGRASGDSRAAEAAAIDSPVRDESEQCAASCNAEIEGAAWTREVCCEVRRRGDGATVDLK